MAHHKNRLDFYSVTDRILFEDGYTVSLKRWKQAKYRLFRCLGWNKKLSDLSDKRI